MAGCTVAATQGERLTDVAIIGAGFAGSCLAHALAHRSVDVTLVDRREAFPDVFRAEKIEPDQAVIMRELGLLELRAPHAGLVGEITCFDDGELYVSDTEEQYGISYSDTVTSLRENLPAGVDFVVGRVDGIHPDARAPKVSLRDGGSLTARLVVLATGGNDAILDSLGLERMYDPALRSLNLGFDLSWDGPPGYERNGFNYFMGRNHATLDYLTIFPIGDRIRANLFLQLGAKDPLVLAFKVDPMGCMFEWMPRLRELIGVPRVASKVQVVPTVFSRVKDPALPGVILAGEELQSVSPTTGMGLSKVLTDVRTLAELVPGWLASGPIDAGLTRRFYRDPRKLEVERLARGRWMHYQRRQLKSVPLSLRVRQRLEVMTMR